MRCRLKLCRCMLSQLQPGKMPAGLAAQGRSSSQGLPWFLGPTQHSRWRAWRLVKWWRCRPSTTTLCKLLAAVTLALVLLHAASCGFFFCYRMPGAPLDTLQPTEDLMAGSSPCTILPRSL